MCQPAFRLDPIIPNVSRYRYYSVIMYKRLLETARPGHFFPLFLFFFSLLLPLTYKRYGITNTLNERTGGNIVVVVPPRRLGNAAYLL